MRTLYMTLLCLVCSNFLFANPSNYFSNNPKEFLDEMEQLVLPSKPAEGKKLISELREIFNKNQISTTEFEVMVNTNNLMESHQLKANPYFLKYLKAVIGLKKNKKCDTQFVAWHKVLDGFLNDIKGKKHKPFKSFLKFSELFFKEGALYFSKSGTSWSATLENFKFSYANHQAQLYFEKTHLIAQSKKGKIEIAETSGTFFPSKNKWKGHGGKTDWKAKHPDLEGVYCELGNYDLNTKKGLYKADSVQLIYPKIFSNQIIFGKIEDKITSTKNKKPSAFPRFESYEHSFDFKNLIKNGTLSGGVKVVGSDFFCTGDSESPATWEQINPAGGKYFELSSFEIKVNNQAEAFAMQATTKIFFDKEFIYHPSIQVKYFPAEEMLNLVDNTAGQTAGPFYDSYHQVLIYSPKLDVMLKEKQMLINHKKFKLGSKTNQIRFDSYDAWNEKEFERITAFSRTSPIILMVALSKRTKKKTFSVDEIAEALGFQTNRSALTSLFVDLSKKGFVLFFPERKEVKVLEKSFHYFDVKEEEIDFDRLIFNSIFDKTNAVLDMEKKEIKIEGVQGFEISKARRVAVVPLDQKMTLKKNRALDFSGNIYAGKTFLQGKQFHFDYEKLLIVMDTIEHMEIFTEDKLTSNRKSKGGKKKYTPLGSTIEEVSGILLIDDPKNKSGRDTTDAFPRFESTSSAYVYYDSKELREGEYKRDSFFFELDEFTFKNVNRIAADELKFKGRLFSPGIFPEIEALLEVQEDGQILGFEKQLPPNGLPLYDGKGKFDGHISLNNGGLKGDGKVTYQSTSFHSEEVDILPKKLSCIGNGFNMKPRSGKNPLPAMQGDSAQIIWLSTHDTMFISPKGAPLKLFEKQDHEFEGDLVLTSDSLSGSGMLSWDLGSLTSEEIRFAEKGIQSDFADLSFKNKDENSIAIDTKNVNANIQFDKNFGSFKSQKKQGTVEFPSNQYKTTLLDFDWDMSEQVVTFNSEEVEFGEFTSTHSRKDSLSFFGKTADFDLKTGLLHVNGVEGISSADSWIETAGKKVTIEKSGEMQTLQEVTIFAGEENKFHVFRNAEVEIIGKNKFTGRGDYEFNLGNKKQLIRNVEVEGDLFGKRKKAKLKTEGNGEIVVADNFFLQEKINFQGDVSMNSHSENVLFEGFARMQATKKNKMHWFMMEHHTEKNDSTIVFSKPKNPDGEILRTGIFISRESQVLYPKVMMPLLARKDRPIFEAIGVLKIAEDQKTFLLGDSTKVASPQNLGNIVQMPTDASNIVAIGKFDVDTFLSPLKLKIVGKADISFMEKMTDEGITIDTTDFKIKALAGLDIPLPKVLKKIILTDIQSSNFETPSNIQNDKDFFLNVLPEFMNNPQDLSKTFKNLTTNQLLVLPQKKNKHTFLLSDLNLKWDKENQSFISTNKELGLVSINGTPVNNMLTGYFQLKLTSNKKDGLYFYLKSPSGNYYFFGFKNGILNTYSNNVVYNDEVMGLKKKEREMEMEDGGLFEIMLGNGSTAEGFVNRVKYMQKNHRK